LRYWSGIIPANVTVKRKKERRDVPPTGITMKREIENATAVLNGKSVWRCMRAASMATFDFGKRRKVPGLGGAEKEVGEFALHVQCAWRITRNDRVAVGSSDLNYPADYSEDKAVPSDFDWERNPNRRDKLLGLLFENGLREFVVQGVDVGAAGSLHIVLSENLALDIFPNDSLSEEHWRLFTPGTDVEHFVVTGTGIDTSTHS
jgi:hypothetical protein